MTRFTLLRSKAALGQSLLLRGRQRMSAHPSTAESSDERVTTRYEMAKTEPPPRHVAKGFDIP
jgi:hypothetical protein